MRIEDLESEGWYGIDACLEVSLLDYGIACIDEGNQTKFLYGIRYDGSNFDRFDYAFFDSDLDVKKEFDWVESWSWSRVYETYGMSESEWDNMRLLDKISDLVSYFGTENIFGSSYGEGVEITLNNKDN
tara:strand:+ start:2377 stop:2763 length:387 start_codon:yes stop_codon:yes gene_type:complete